MNKPKNEPDAPAAESHVPEMVRWISIFLLAVSAVTAPLFSSDHLSLRTLCLMLGIAGAFFWLMQAIFERKLEVPWGWHIAGGALILAAAIASAFASDCPQEAILTMLVWLAYASAFVLAVWIGRNERLRRGILCVVCATAVPISVLAVMQYTYLLDRTNAEIRAGEHDDVIGKLPLEVQKGYLARTENKRVFSTFALPNSLAGYLLVLLPALIALLALAKRSAAKWILLALVLLLLLSLFFTFSKGGWLVGLILLALFLISRGRKWLAHRWGLAAGIVVAAAVVLAAGIALSPTLRTRLDKMAKELGGSARVRTEYWTAGLSMWRSSPALGIGPGNFKHYYMTHKLTAAEEVQHAHNDYLQILAECGPLALAGYVLFWLAILLGLARRREEPLLPPEPPPLQPVLAIAGVLSVLAAGFFGQLLGVFRVPIADAVFVSALAGVWLIAYWACWRSIVKARPQPLAFGLLLGVLAFALHSLIDMDLYVEGIGYTACLVAGLTVAPWTRVRHVRLRGALQLVVAAIVGIAGIGLLYGAQRVHNADAQRVLGRSLAEKEAGRPLSTAARKALRTACKLNPFDHRAFAERAAWLQRSPVAADLEAAVEAWRRAVALAPAYPSYHSHLGRLFAQLTRHAPALLRPYIEEYKREGANLPAGRVPDILLPALVETARAVERAPTTPQYRIHRGDVLLRARRRAEAEREFRKALELNDEMIKGGAPKRQWLSEAEIKHLLSTQIQR